MFRNTVWPFLLATTCVGCTYILGLEGDFATENATTQGGTGAGSSSSTTTSSGDGGTGGGSGGAGGGCAECVPKEVTAAVRPWAIVADGTNLYWTEHGEQAGQGRVMQMPLAGGMNAKSLANNQQEPRGIAVDENHVYWTNISSGSVHRAPIDGFDQSMIETLGMVVASSGPANIALDATNIYWNNFSSNQVMMLPLSDLQGTQTPLAEGLDAASSEGIAVHNGYLYWTGDGGVRRKQIDPMGNVEEVSTGSAKHVVVTDAHVYWTESGENGKVMRASLFAFAEQDEVASAQPYPEGLAVDDAYVYWTTTGSNDGGQVMRRALDLKTEPVVLADAQSGPRGITVQGEYVYWVNYEGSAVMKRRKE